MTHDIQKYLERVMRHSGLSKREKVSWIEEMSVHLQEETLKLTNSGYEEEDATRLALRRFGEPVALRKRISRETFGLPTMVIFFLSSICFVAFCIDLYVFYVHPMQSPGTWYRGYRNTWKYVHNLITTVPLSTTIMLGLCIGFLSLFKTRCRKDRAGVVLTLMVFGVLWVLIKLPMPFFMNELLFGFKNMTIMEPTIVIIDGLLFVWGVFLYIWTKNRWISLLPIFITIAIGLMWRGQFLFETFTFVAVLVHCIPVILLFIAYKAVDKYMTNHRSLKAD